MSPLEATVRIMENLSVTGKLSELNVGQTFDLTEHFLTLFSASKPKRKANPKTVEIKPAHVDMNEIDKKEDDEWA